MRRAVKKFPVIGGPLDGQYANQKDFHNAYEIIGHPEWSRPAGQFEAHKDSYGRFNSGDGRSPSSMVWLYLPTIPNPERMPQ